jgi:hypothetical protein
MKKHYFSLFYDKHKGHKTVTPAKTITFEKLVEIYQSEYIQKATAAILAATDLEEKQRLKMALPFITPYGCFTYRNTEGLTSYNSGLIAFDFDGMTTQQAHELKSKLAAHRSTMLTAISPRQKGVKALVSVMPRADKGREQITNEGLTDLIDSFDLVPEYSNLHIQSHYNDLKHNAGDLLAALNLSDYSAFLDPAQFVLPQPYFIAYDAKLHSNLNAAPMAMEWTEYTPPQRPELKLHDTIEGFAKTRIEAYLMKAAERLAMELRNTPEGSRHRSIVKCRNIFSWLHYAPHLSDTIYSILFDAVCAMYGGLSRATDNNGIKSLNKAQSDAVDVPNAVIEGIIQELNSTAA